MQLLATLQSPTQYTESYQLTKLHCAPLKFPNDFLRIHLRGEEIKKSWFMTANSNSIFMCVSSNDNRGIMQWVRDLWSISHKIFPHKTLSLHYPRTPLSVRLANATFIKEKIFAHFECSPYKSLFDRNCKIIFHMWLATYASPSKRIF